MLLLETVTTEGLLLGAKALGVTFVLYLLGLTIYNRFFHPYKNIPGPFWASITTLWYFRSMRYGIRENTHWPLHQKYGTMVRIAPNMVAISDPAAIETIYGAKNVFLKTAFYDGFNPGISPRRDGFCDRDEAHHTARRRIIQPLYSQNVVLSFEPRFDRVVKLFYEKMDRFAQTGQVIDMSTWLTKYTFDIIGEIFYGYEGGFGMVRDDIDFNGWLHLMRVMPAPASAVSYVPYGLQTLYLMSQLLAKESRDGFIGTFTVIKQAKAAVAQRLEEMKQPDYKFKNDILSKLIKIADERGQELNWHYRDVTTELWMIIWAGSDTTAIALSSIFWHLHKHPHILEKLRAEIDTAFDNGSLSYPIRFNDAIKLPYLWAVVQESMRMHSSLGTGLPRVVPKGGAEILGRYVPEGCHVIMTANAVHFHAETFGHDCHEFIPERWLRDGERKAAEMERSMIQFGYGPRMCQGKNVTNTEMYKILPTILRDFNFELVTDDWKVRATWFAHPEDMKVKVSRRRAENPFSS